MPAIWPAKIVRACKGKIRFPSQGAANAAARALERLDAREGRTLGSVKGYFCVRCRKFHIGHSREAAA
jgi:hypothetical protein